MDYYLQTVYLQELVYEVGICKIIFLMEDLDTSLHLEIINLRKFSFFRKKQTVH